MSDLDLQPYGVDTKEAYYGAPIDSDQKPLRERLRDYYTESEFIEVKNIDKSPLKYQFMSPENQVFISNAAYHGEIHNIKPPQVVILKPNETKLCPAYEADLMIEACIKQVTNSRQAEKIKKGLARPDSIADWTEPNTQKTLIEQIFLGKQDLIGKFNQTDSSNERRPGRPPREPQTA